MTIYSSDYNARTRELVNDRGQRAREVAVSAAATVLASTLNPTIDVTEDQIAAAIIKVAESLNTYIQLG